MILTLLMEGTDPEGHMEKRNSCRKLLVPFLLPASLALKNITLLRLQKKKLGVYFVIFYYISVSEEGLFCSVWDLFIEPVEFLKQC